MGDGVLRKSALTPATLASEVTYIAAIAVGAIGSIVALLATLLVLQQGGILPAPALSNNLCIDEKLAFMRERNFRSPNLLVLGSSVGWRSIDSSALASTLTGLKPVNGAFCGLRMHQIEFVGDWLLDRMPSVQTVLLVVSPFDFVGCKTNPRQVFDRQAADEFVFDGRWRWKFYFRYFDPVSMVRNVSHIAALRSPHAHNSLAFTPFGDGPLDINDSKKTLVYGRLPMLDSDCFAALRRLAIALSNHHRHLAIVASPRHPKWTAQFDQNGSTLEAFRFAISAAIEGTDAIYWDSQSDRPLPIMAFTDAIHIRWSAAQEFTRTIVDALGSYLAPRAYLAPRRMSRGGPEPSWPANRTADAQQAPRTSTSEISPGARDTKIAGNSRDVARANSTSTTSTRE
jgi:hypothetical protein